MAQGYVEELNRVVTDNTTSAARRERIFLEGRVKEIKQNLDDSAKQLSQFSTKSGAIDMPSQTKSMVDEGLKIAGRTHRWPKPTGGTCGKLTQRIMSRVRLWRRITQSCRRELDKMGGVASGIQGLTPMRTSLLTLRLTNCRLLGLTYYDLERKMRVEEALWEALTRQYEAAKVEEAEEIPTVHDTWTSLIFPSGSPGLCGGGL